VAAGLLLSLKKAIVLQKIAFSSKIPLLQRGF
jgi:hypothetical protein